MNTFFHHAVLNRARATQSVRRGSTLLELLVAFTLTIATLSISVPLVVRHGRLLTDADHYRIALDELTNQLERLRATPASQVSEVLAQLKPSGLAAQRLVGAKLEGKFLQGESSRRIKLQLYWDEPQRREIPVELVAWLPSENAGRPEADGAGRQP